MVEIRCTETHESQLSDTPIHSSAMKNLTERHDDKTPTLCRFYSYKGNLSALFGFAGEQRPHHEMPLRSQASFEKTPKNSSPNRSTHGANGIKQANSSSSNRHQASSKGKHENLPLGDELITFSEETCEKLPSDDSELYADAMKAQNSDDELPLKCQNITDEEEKSHSDSTRLTLVDCSVMCVPVYNGPIHVNARSIKSPENDTPFVHSATGNSNMNFGQPKNNYYVVPRSVGGYLHKKNTILSASAIKSIGKRRSQKSMYRGVTRHKWTGKFEAHLWDGNSSTEGHTRKGKQVYLGGYETAEEAARAHDLTALKFWGPNASPKLNFHIFNYGRELKEMESMSREELVIYLRRQSLSFTRGTSIYRGVTRNREGHWQARIKVASSKKDIYLGTFSSEEEAAKAYDLAAIHFKGVNALTNFEISNYLQGDPNELESFPRPKRVRRSSKHSDLTSECETDPHPEESIPESDCLLEEITRRKISAILPDHPTAIIPDSELRTNS